MILAIIFGIALFIGLPLLVGKIIAHGVEIGE